jgi:histidine triad (HIT) family protein
VAGCIFCSIIDGTASAAIVYEDDRAVAFLDLFPVHAGHTLVVPRQHVEDLVASPPDIAGHLMKVAQRLAPRIVRVVDAAGFNVWTANGKAAGQEVFHCHLHILPRFENDTFGLRFPKSYPQEAERGELDSLADRIRETE